MTAIDRFFKEGRLVQIPRKEKNKLLLFEHLASFFDFDREYKESEVNLRLKEVYADYAILRRYLVDYDYLIRENDGSLYKKSKETYRGSIEG